MKVFYFLLISVVFLFATTPLDTKVVSSISKNIWLKTYQNYKNYNIIVSNISKTEEKIKKNKNNTEALEKLHSKLLVFQSKLELYEKNNNFNTILRKYKFDIPVITLRDFALRISEDKLDIVLKKYGIEKNDFYLAMAKIKNDYELAVEKNIEPNKLSSLKNDIEYFNDFAENIEKSHQNLQEIKDDLNSKYNEYENEIFTKHIFTIVTIFVGYLVYKILSSIMFFITHNKENHEDQKNYRKLLSLLFVLVIFLFIIVRYIDDFMYIITFLSVIAAALTIATREIILNIAGAIYIFFSSIVRVGDRVMVQFETKHTIGDIVDISLVKMKLSEVTDYSNLKEIKSVGRTIYVPNSYIFTKVFYNYSLKKNDIINELIEFEFDVNNDFDYIEKQTHKVLETKNIKHTITYSLNNLKTGIVQLLSYEINYKESTKTRGEISIALMQEYTSDALITLKSSKAAPKAKAVEDE